MTYKQSKHIHAFLTGWKSKRLRVVLTVFACLFPSFALAPAVFAAGDASYSFSNSGGTTVGNAFTIVVSETSSAGDNVNAVQANVTYPTAQLQYQSMSLGAFNQICPQNSPSAGQIDVACANSSTLSGTQTVMTINFTVLAAGSAQVKMSSGSDIDSTSGASVWNGTLSSASYTFNTAPVSGGGGTTGGTSGGTSSSGGSTSSSGSGSKSGGSSGGSTKSSGTPATGSSGTTSTPSTTTTPVTTTPTPTTSGTTVSPELSVTITDTSGNPVDGAKVVIDSKYTAYTNAQGKASFTGIAAGSHSVSVSASGKKAATSTFSLASNESKTVALKMTASKSPVMAVMYVLVGLIILGGAGFGYIKFAGNKNGGVPQAPLASMPVGSNIGPSSTIPTYTPAVPGSPNTPVTQIIRPTELPTDISIPAPSDSPTNTPPPPTPL
jgi:hypothetical protein